MAYNQSSQITAAYDESQNQIIDPNAPRGSGGGSGNMVYVDNWALITMVLDTPPGLGNSLFAIKWEELTPGYKFVTEYADATGQIFINYNVSEDGAVTIDDVTNLATTAAFGYDVNGELDTITFIGN